MSDSLTNHEITICLAGGAVLGPFKATWSKDIVSDVRELTKDYDAFMRSGALLPFCVPFNITGQPAISLPLHMSEDGLPVGVQLIAAAGREDLLIRVAAQLEADVKWSERKPPLHA